MLLKRMGFASKKRMYSFLTIVMSGQIIYSSFEAFKGTFYNNLLLELHVDNTQLGLLFTIRGLSLFFFVFSAWANNRFSIKHILFYCCGYRLLTMMFIILYHPSFTVLVPIFFTWAIVESMFWPAVVNGVAIESTEKNKGLGFGLLESLRRAAELLMNLLLVFAMSMAADSALVFKGGMIVYTLIIIPMMFYIWKYVPNNIKENKQSSDPQSHQSSNKMAWEGARKMLKTPIVWLAGFVSLTIYWNYITLIYTVPYLHSVFHVSESLTSTFGAINTDGIGVVSGVIAGLVADHFFKSATKVIATVLLLAGCCLLLLLNNFNAIYLNIIVIFLFSFFTFMAKGVILAPVAEMNFSPQISGSAMSVASFLTYSPNFWAYVLNGWLIDHYSHHSAKLAYDYIFTIGAVVSLVGGVLALFLVHHLKRFNQNRQNDLNEVVCNG